MTLRRYWGLENCRSLYAGEMILYSMPMPELEASAKTSESGQDWRTWELQLGTSKRILDTLKAI